MTTWKGPCCSGFALMLLLLPQPGRVVAGPESRGGVYDHRYGYQPGGSGAALHLLHFTQKVRSLRAIDHWLIIFTFTPFQDSVLVNETSIFIDFVFLL